MLVLELLGIELDDPGFEKLRAHQAVRVLGDGHRAEVDDPGIGDIELERADAD